MWTLLDMLLVFTDAASVFRVGGLVCALYPSDTVYPKTHKASAPKNPRLPPPDRKCFISVNPSGTLRYYALIKMHPLLPSRLRICLVGCHGLLLGCLECTLAYRLFPTQFPMDVFVVPWKEDGQDIRDFFSPGRSLVSTASERSMCR